MRHSSIDLKMNVYADQRVLDVTALPLNGAPQDWQRARAAGTDDGWSVDGPPKVSLHQCLRQIWAS